MTGKSSAFLACAAALACFACDNSDSKGRSEPAAAATHVAYAEPSAGETDEAAILARARAVITKHRLTRIPSECLKLEIESTSPSIYAINVYEVHNDQCGGDPEVEPRLFSLHLSRTDAKVWTDAKSHDGEFQLLPE